MPYEYYESLQASAFHMRESLRPAFRRVDARPPAWHTPRPPCTLEWTKRTPSKFCIIALHRDPSVRPDGRQCAGPAAFHNSTGGGLGGGLGLPERLRNRRRVAINYTFLGFPEVAYY